MPKTELFVSLKAPDSAAITAFNTLKRMGYNELLKLERTEYYSFDISGDENKFAKEISNVDIIINANKHKFSFSLEEFNKDKKNNKENKNIDYKKISILVQDFDNGTGLLSLLKERLGFENIKKIEKGVLWTMSFDKKTDAGSKAIEITKGLLMNENYQSFEIIN